MKQYTINEITSILNNRTIDQKLLKELKKDSRKGVIKLIDQYEKEQQEFLLQKKHWKQMTTYEKELHGLGYSLVAGVDEVGRGPLAGPVVASAVILPRQVELLGINDSKQLTDAKKEYYFQLIQDVAISIGIGFIHAQKIDEVNIYEATKLAMKEAITQLKPMPDFLLIDAMKLELDIKQKSIIKGDQNSASIAASSIIAKVTRDNYMKKLAEEYPQYGFQNHMGYGTKQHLEAISLNGIISEHRRSFAPIKEVASSKS
ncbi:ribonuclease HII [Bacillus mesophilus]|uniref:Ribonuclease HII n=1 Tax=Bacillus mesophilus TaxID=1808955 RepID=A0A6M0Q2B1_9BACI|nr:ribonuclease HII [Bacillus mesophilus]MBM7659381.1 ribonuclease HII [Bacillus mesophilus]NEY70253.1 ribonuclease HII [Bacillus mesophilus]